MPRIDRIRIENFRGASSPFSIAVAKQKRLVVIFGENGTGKTTIVDALDAVGNGSGGSLTTKSSTTLRTHLPTVGKKPSDMVMEVSSGPTTWTATLGKSGIATTPTPRPPIQVLRRTTLQRFIDSPPGDRYKELRHLIGVERVEKAEETLKRALDGAKQQLDTTARLVSEAEDQLVVIWQQEGCPEGTWRGWARAAATVDVAHLQERVQRSRATREVIRAAVHAKGEWEQAEAALAAAHQAVTEIEREIATAPALQATRAMALVEILGKVRRHVATGEDGDVCPVCEQAIPLAELQRSLDRRLADLIRYQELGERQRRARERLRTAGEIDERATTALREAATRLATIAERPSPEFAALSVPGALLAAFADAAERSAEQAAEAVALIEACVPLDSALQAEEDAANQAAARHTTIRALVSRVVEHRKTSLEVERIAEGLARAHEVVRLGRIEFTQRILDEVAQECNRLYAQIHPDEGIAIAKIELDQQRRASINQTMNFGGYTEIVPQAYLSEAHLDTFGFCFWLAFAKREHPGGDAVLVLDDVFSSVDAPHLTRITELIVNERVHFAQMIITTHQREWRDAIRNAHGPANLTDLIELQSWSLAQGIFSYQTQPAVEELRAALRAAPFNRQAAASTAGILLEATLNRLTFLYRSQVPRTRTNEYTLNELLDATAKLFKKLEVKHPVCDPSGQIASPLTYNSVCPAEIVDKLRRYVHVRNQVGAHHNVQGMAVSDADVRTFAELTAQLVECLVCRVCGQIPSKSTGAHLSMFVRAQAHGADVAVAVGVRSTMSGKQRLELTWIGKENRPRLEPRILLEDPDALPPRRPPRHRPRSLRQSPDLRRQPARAQGAGSGVRRQGQMRLHRPTLQHRQRLHPLR